MTAPLPDGRVFPLLTDDGSRTELHVPWSWTQADLEGALRDHVYLHVRDRQTNVPSECLFVRGLGYWHVTVRFTYVRPGGPVDAASVQLAARGWSRSTSIGSRLRGCYGAPTTSSEVVDVWELPGLRVEHGLFEGPRDDGWDTVAFRPVRVS